MEIENEKKKPLDFNFKSSDSRLKDLLSTKKNVEYFKFHFRDNELPTVIKVVSKTINKSLLRVDHLISNHDFFSLVLIYECEVSSQLEVIDQNQQNHNKGENDDFISKLKTENISAKSKPYSKIPRSAVTF